MGHQVVWEKLNASIPNADAEGGFESRILRRGEYLPDEVPDATKAILLQIGAVRIVDTEMPAPASTPEAAANAPLPAPEDSPPAAPSAAPPAGFEPPAVADPKSAWVDYAVTVGGMDRTEAENMKKDELVDRFKARQGA